MTMPKSTLLAALLGLAAGAAVAFQAPINARMRQAFASPLQAALVSFVVGSGALVLLVAVESKPWPRGGFGGVPWWGWIGGTLGAFYITASIFLAPRIGALALVGLVVAGQLATALVLDHFGMLSLPRQPITLARLAGAAMFLAGVWLFMRREK